MTHLQIINKRENSSLLHHSFLPINFDAIAPLPNAQVNFGGIAYFNIPRDGNFVIHPEIKISLNTYDIYEKRHKSSSY